MVQPSSTAIRAANRSSIIETLRRLGEATRAELAAQTGLSRATVSSLVADLQAQRLISERRPPAPSNAGRPPSVISLNRSAGLAIAVDIGVSHVAVAFGDLSRRVLAERWITVPHGHAARDGLETVFQCIEESMAEAGASRDQVVGAAISIAAPVTSTSGRLVVPGVLPGWNSQEVATAVGDRWGIPVAIENDANVGALGESTFGTLAGVENLLYVKLASRVGLGIVVGGSIYRGNDGHAGELGHLMVVPDGEQCWCGLRGCLELYAGGDGILRQLRQAGVPVQDIDDLLQRAARGEPAVVQAVGAAAEVLARGLVALALLLNPAAIVVGGELAELGAVLMDPIRRRVARVPFGEPTRVVRSSLGGRASMVGAMALVLAESERFVDRSSVVTARA